MNIKNILWCVCVLDPSEKEKKDFKVLKTNFKFSEEVFSKLEAHPHAAEKYLLHTRLLGIVRI